MPVTGLQLVAQPPSRSLAVGEVVVLRLKLVLPADAKPDAVRGLLRISTAGGEPFVTEVAAESTPAAEPRYTFEQGEVETTLTRWLGPFSGNRSSTRTVGIRDATPAVAPPDKPMAQTLVALSGSGVASVKLRPPKQGSSEVKRGEVVVYRADGTGSATGTLALAKKGDGTKLKVTTRMQDFVLWPLAAILFGALLGQVLPEVWKIRRRSELIRDALVTGVKEYDQARQRARRSNAPGLENIGADVGPNRQWRRGLTNLPRPGFWPQQLWFSDPPSTGAAGIYSQLGRVRTKEALKTEASKAETLLTRIANWRATDAALSSLAKAVDETEPLRDLDATEMAPLADSEELFASAIPIASDAKQASAEIDRIKGQATALRLYTLAMPLYLKLKKRQNDFDTDGKQRLRRSNPLTMYGRHGTVHTRSSASTASLVAELGDSLATLRLLSTRLSDPPDAALPAGAEETLTVAFVSIGRRFEQLRDWLIDQIAPTRVPSTAEVMGSVRRGDKLLFWGTVLVAALVYLLPLYAGKAWGSPADYASAFAAGFVGTVVANAALLPLAQSYQPFPPEAAATTATGAAGSTKS